MLMATDAIKITGSLPPEFEFILTAEALQFIIQLQRAFSPVRLQLLEARKMRQRELNAGALPTFLTDTAHIRNSKWEVAATPPDLQQRWVEITGPVDRKPRNRRVAWC